MTSRASFFSLREDKPPQHAKISAWTVEGKLNNGRRSILLKVCRSRFLLFRWKKICGKNRELAAYISSAPEKRRTKRKRQVFAVPE